MRFLFFASGSYVSGQETVTLTLMRELQAQGHQCLAVVSGWNDGLYPQQLSEAGIPHACIKLGRLYLAKPMWTLDGLIHFPKAAIELRKCVASFRPDVAIITSIEYGLTLLQVLPKSLPLVLHVHDIPNPNFARWVGRYVVPKLLGILSVSDFIRDLAEKLARGKPVETVHNGVPHFEMATQQPASTLRLGIIGQILPRKKHDVLVEAVALLDPKIRERIEVRIYGRSTSDYAKSIRELIDLRGVADCFRWMGFITPVANIYRDLDVVLAPAVGEPFGLTVLEANAFGLPVIAADSGGFPETICEGINGVLVKDNNALALSEAIRDMCDCDKRALIAKATQNFVRERFSPRIMATRFVDVIRGMGIETGVNI